MARVKPIDRENLSPSVKVAFARHIDSYNGNITNMKSLLGHSLLAFETYMQWYPLYESIESILGRRLAAIYAYGISSGSNCEVCIAYFLKLLTDYGDATDKLSLTPSQRNILNFGVSIAKHNGHIADHLYSEVAKEYEEKDMVTLIAFAGQMIATNIFNNVAETDVDDYLVAHVSPAKFC